MHYIFSSNPLEGAKDLDAIGSSFSVQFDEPILIPNEAANVSLSCEETAIWNTSPNISINKGNNKFYVQRELGDLTEMTIDDGLYSIDDLNQKLSVLLEQHGFADNLIELVGEESTGHVLMTFNDTNVVMDFSQANTPRLILGFNAEPYPNGVTSPFIFRSESIAKVNVTNSIYVHCDLVRKGLMINGVYSSIINRIVIDVEPGVQIIHSPTTPCRSMANGLIGDGRSTARFWLTEDNGTLFNTNGEYWSLRLVVRYTLPHDLIHSNRN